MPANSMPAGRRGFEYAMGAVFLLGCLAAALSLLGCLGLAGFAIHRAAQRNTERPATARDGSCQNTLPPGWVGREPKDVGVLKAGISSDRAAFLVTRLAKEDAAAGWTCRDEGRRAVNNLLVGPEFENMKVLRGPEDRGVNGRSAVQYELEGLYKPEARRFIYILTFVEGERSIFMLTTTLLPSDAGRFRDAGDKIVGSFKELP
jgi:hypothetical protein